MPSEPPATAPEARVDASLRGRVAERVDPALPPVIRAGVVEVLSAVLDATTARLMHWRYSCSSLAWLS